MKVTETYEAVLDLFDMNKVDYDDELQGPTAPRLEVGMIQVELTDKEYFVLTITFNDKSFRKLYISNQALSKVPLIKKAP